MTDSVSRTGKIDAVFFRDRANKTMVVGILKARLQRIMVYVCHGALRADALDAHALKFEIRHRARRVRVSVWSIFKAISFPAFISPETRCFAMIFCAIVCPIFFLYTSEFYYFFPKRAGSISESIVSSSSSETADTLPSS